MNKRDTVFTKCVAGMYDNFLVELLQSPTCAGLQELNLDTNELEDEGTTIIIKALAAARHMTIADSRNLADALHFIQQQRIKHQCEQILKGEKVSNFLNPRDLPKMAKEQLRDAFTIIDEAQSAVRQRYRAGMG